MAIAIENNPESQAGLRPSGAIKLRAAPTNATGSTVSPGTPQPEWQTFQKTVEVISRIAGAGASVSSIDNATALAGHRQ